MFTEYGVQIGITAGIIGGILGIFLTVGSVIGGLYLLFWILEETGAMDDNPIDEFLFVTLV